MTQTRWLNKISSAQQKSATLEYFHSLDCNFLSRGLYSWVQSQEALFVHEPRSSFLSWIFLLTITNTQKVPIILSHVLFHQEYYQCASMLNLSHQKSLIYILYSALKLCLRPNSNSYYSHKSGVFVKNWSIWSRLEACCKNAGSAANCLSLAPVDQQWLEDRTGQIGDNAIDGSSQTKKEVIFGTAMQSST